MAEIKYNNGTSWTAITANDIGAADLTTANMCVSYVNGCYIYMGTKVVSPSSATAIQVISDADFKSTFHTTDPMACGVAFMNGDYAASGNIGAVNAEYWDKNSKGWWARWVSSRTGSTRFNWIVVVPESAHDTSYDTDITANDKVKYLSSNNEWVSLTPLYFNAATKQKIEKLKTQLNNIYVKAGTFVKNVGTSVTTTQLWNSTNYKNMFHTDGNGYTVVSDGDHGAQPVWLMGTEWRNSTWYARWESSSSKSGNKRFNYITFVASSNHNATNDKHTTTYTRIKYPIFNQWLQTNVWTALTPAQIGAGTQTDLDAIQDKLKSGLDSTEYDGCYIYAGTLVRQSSYYTSQNNDYAASYCRVWKDADFCSDFHVKNTDIGLCGVIISNGAANTHNLGPLGTSYRNTTSYGTYSGWYAQWNNSVAGFPKRFNYIVIVPSFAHSS